MGGIKTKNHLTLLSISVTSKNLQFQEEKISARKRARSHISMEKSSKNYMSLIRGKPTRGLRKPPPTPPHREFAESTRGKCASARRGGNFQAWNWGAENGGEGGTRNGAIVNGLMYQLQTQSNTKIANTILLLFCIDKMCLSPSGVLWHPSASFYSGAEPIKGSPSWQPALSQLHYILQSTPL